MTGFVRGKRNVGRPSGFDVADISAWVRRIGPTVPVVSAPAEASVLQSFGG